MTPVNGTKFMIQKVPCVVIGKTEEGKIIFQTNTGLQMNVYPETFKLLVDDKPNWEVVDTSVT